MSSPPKRSSAASDAGPSRRPVVLSPAYNNRRHSLYGTDDRVVIDPGARVWKVGYSGEPDPRGVFWAVDDADAARTSAGELYDLDLCAMRGAHGSRTEARRLVAGRITRRLRDTFHKHLLTDGKARKVIVVENTFLPTYVKEEIANALFENLKAPSVAFTPSSLLALVACGRATGLVVDCGWLETTVTPVYASRPLNHLARSTPTAGRMLFTRLRALLRQYGKYYPPSLPRHRAPEPIAPPLSVLTDRLVERVLTEACFVSEEEPQDASEPVAMMGVEPMEHPAEIDDRALMFALKERYQDSDAADWTLLIPAPRGIGPGGRLVVPGWVREYATEVLFGDGPNEDPAIPEVVLDTLARLPADLRAEMAPAVLITGGIASLPGMIQRVRTDMIRYLPPDPTHAEDLRGQLAAWRTQGRERYPSLYGLDDKIAVLNDPAPVDGMTGGRGGAVPRWVPHLLPWVGASLAGLLKTSSVPLIREDYDQLVTEAVERGDEYKAAIEAEREGAPAPSVGLDIEELRPGMVNRLPAAVHKRGWGVGDIVPDWTTTRIRAGV